MNGLRRSRSPGRVYELRRRGGVELAALVISAFVLAASIAIAILVLALTVLLLPVAFVASHVRRV